MKWARLVFVNAKQRGILTQVSLRCPGLTASLALAFAESGESGSMLEEVKHARAGVR